MYNHEWTNLNRNRKFPFKEECSLIDTSARYALPHSLFVDAIISVPINYQFDFYLSKLTYSPDIFYIEISMRDGTVALTGTWRTPDTSEVNKKINLNGVGDYLGAYGKIVVGSLDDMIENDLAFFANACVFEPCRIIKLSHGVNSINNISSGNVILSSKSNAVITPDGNIIYLDTFDGLCACGDCPTVKTVNGQPPVNNNLQITGIGCVKVLPSESGITITNECEDSCCGCDEVNDMLDRIFDLERRIAILEASL